MTASLVLPEVIGHRGAPRRAPENSLAGFAEAARLGVPWVELDVQASRDLVPMVFHDARLERTSDGTGALIERDSAYLAGLDVGGWYSPAFKGELLPSFATVLDQLISLGLGLNMEIKAEDERAALTAEVGLSQALRQWPVDRPPPLVSSFSRPALAAAQKLAPDWPRGLVADIWLPDWQSIVTELGCSTIHIGKAAITAETVREARALGLQVLGYVVDEPAVAHQLWGWGVASVFSDRPDQLLR